jgi:hypothetical protein
MLCMAVSSFLPVPRLGLVNPEGYIAFSLFPHLSAIPPGDSFTRLGLSGRPEHLGRETPWCRCDCESEYVVMVDPGASYYVQGETLIEYPGREGSKKQN